ncbi:MAG: geranylgeranylglyceryl/heptaprenylglyceryl phosphate synthase [Bacteroidetes bacterium]|nr:MAG: geranylgeranylglyceryl/heptaprenylglyceryl phosphate synthase [Bacteroidota bacterium]
MNVTERFNRNQKQLAVLVDPDKLNNDQLELLTSTSQKAGVDFFFVGGSLLTSGSLDTCVKILKANSNIPVVLFPGNTYQVSNHADAILFLSLISGRNPDMLIGMHVISAPYIKMSGLEVVPTGYMLIDSGKPTAVTYMSNSFPIPSDKKDIAACTAMAGEMLGMKLIFMDAGSGAQRTVSEDMIGFVKQSVNVPVIVGGGIKTEEKLESVLFAGADIAVIGNKFETEPGMIAGFAEKVREINESR